MKKINIPTIVALLTGLILSSCTKWLEEESLSQHVMRDFYKTLPELEAGLLGLYADIRSHYNSGAYMVTVAGTDEIYATNPQNNTGVVDRHSYSASNANTTTWYRMNFRTIQRANIVINHAPNVPDISTEDMNRVIGEARAIRAWCYFRLVQTFGPVPLELTETESFNFLLKRNSIQEVYQAIIDDLTFAMTDGVLTTEHDPIHINHWTAKGLLAKVYLTLGTSILRRPQPIPEYRDLPWTPDDVLTHCKELCDDIIENGKYELVDVYGDIFTINKKNGKESLWEIQYSSEPEMGGNWSKQLGVGTINGRNSFTSNGMIGQTFYKPIPGFYRMFKLGDIRRDWSIATYRIVCNSNTGDPESIRFISSETIGSTNEIMDLDTDDPDLLMRILQSGTAREMGISKYRWGQGADPAQYWAETINYAYDNTPNNIIVLRYADILLMRIEADLLINNGTVSEKSLDLMNNQLLARARGWNTAYNRWNTETEMQEIVLAPYQVALDEARKAFENDPSNPELEAALTAAQQSYDAKRARTLVNYTTTTLTYEELLSQRACELCFEFHRWFDLVRTGTLHTLVPQRIVDPSFIPPVQLSIDRNYLLPIPTYELDLASDKALFYQNPGY